MRIIFLMFLITLASGEPAFAQHNSINELRQMFDYDQTLPLEIKEVGFRDIDGARIHDINYASPKFGRVTAYLIEPNSSLDPWSATARRRFSSLSLLRRLCYK